MLFCRRAYDRSLANDNSIPTYGRTSHSGTASGRSSQSHWTYEWTYETRRRGATHAWENTRRSGTGGTGSTYHRTPPRYSSPDPHHRNPFASPNVRRATGQKAPPGGEGRTMTDADRVQNVSSLLRAMQVIGLVVVVATLGGGWTAKA
jgi:hypothetical protein